MQETLLSGKSKELDSLTENDFINFRDELKKKKNLNSTGNSAITELLINSSTGRKRKKKAKLKRKLATKKCQIDLPCTVVKGIAQESLQRTDKTTDMSNNSNETLKPQTLVHSSSLKHSSHSSSREEGEIRSENDETMKAHQPPMDDDCIFIEKEAEKNIVVVDDDDDDIFFEDVTGSKTLICKPISMGNATSPGCTVVLNSSDVIIIDETSASETNITKTSRFDDSIQFVSETMPDYIPLESNNVKKTFDIVKNPMVQRKKTYMDNSLFSKSEKKQLAAYNVNTYNPNVTEQLKSRRLNSKRLVIIDGSNVAFAHSRRAEFSVKGLEICIKLFQQMGHEVKAVIPQFRLKQGRSTDPAAIDRMYTDGLVVLTPCKSLPIMSAASYDDRFILQLASELDAAIVSNDNYRDLINENTAFKKLIENRVITFSWCGDLFIVPKDPYGRFGPTLHSILNREIEH